MLMKMKKFLNWLEVVHIGQKNLKLLDYPNPKTNL